MKTLTIKTLFALSFCAIFSCSIAQEQIEYASNWRGPDRDGKYNETGLLKSWGETGPEMLWSYEGIGEGHSSVAIDGDNIFIAGMVDSTGYISLFNKAGELQWKRPYGLEWNYSFNGSRSTPTIYQNKIYILSGRGKIICLNESNGEKIWSVDLHEKYAAQKNSWGLTENLIIYDNKVLCSAGGSEDNIIALNADTGEKVWSCKGLGEQNAYGSSILIKHASKNLLITYIGQSVLCVNADNGELLWSHPHECKYPIHANTPIYKDGAIFCESGYGLGSILLKISDDNSSVTQVWKNDSLDNNIGGAVLHDGYIYSSGAQFRGWKCVDWNTGEEKYNDTEFKGNGVTIFADGMLYQYSDKGVIALVKPNPEKHEIVSQFKVPLGKKQHWAHPVIDNGKLYVRHGNALMVYNIKK